MFRSDFSTVLKSIGSCFSRSQALKQFTAHTVCFTVLDSFRLCSNSSKSAEDTFAHLDMCAVKLDSPPSVSSSSPEGLSHFRSNIVFMGTQSVGSSSFFQCHICSGHMTYTLTFPSKAKRSRYEKRLTCARIRECLQRSLFFFFETLEDRAPRKHTATYRLLRKPRARIHFNTTEIRFMQMPFHLIFSQHSIDALSLICYHHIRANTNKDE